MVRCRSISSASVEIFANLTTLRNLSLSGAAMINSAAFARLSALTLLRTLDLSETAIGDEDLMKVTSSKTSLSLSYSTLLLFSLLSTFLRCGYVLFSFEEEEEVSCLSTSFLLSSSSERHFSVTCFFLFRLFTNRKSFASKMSASFDWVRFESSASFSLTFELLPSTQRRSNLSADKTDISYFSLSGIDRELHFCFISFRLPPSPFSLLLSYLLSSCLLCSYLLSGWYCSKRNGFGECEVSQLAVTFVDVWHCSTTGSERSTAIDSSADTTESCRSESDRNVSKVRSNTAEREGNFLEKNFNHWEKKSFFR